MESCFAHVVAHDYARVKPSNFISRMVQVLTVFWLEYRSESFIFNCGVHKLSLES